MAKKTNSMYSDYSFSYRQVRDCVKGTNAIKRANEVYLPMPSSMNEIQHAASSSNFSGANIGYSITSMPWYHNNPAYRAYLQRARFPDITANTLRGTLGVATKAPPKYEFPSSLSYLELNVDNNGTTIEQFYSNLLSENIQVGKAVIVADIDPSDNKFYLKIYQAECNTDWESVCLNGEKIYTSVRLTEDESEQIEVEYYLNDDGQAAVRWTKDDKPYVPEGKESGDFVLSYMGKTFNRLPIQFVGSVVNEAEPNILPLLGISDIAISIYQEDADLRQAHFLTCNPTLFLFGVGQKETPKIIGSQVIVGITNPNGKAEYPATDTSALEHIRNYTKDLYLEAANYGANFIATPGNRESGDALSLRNAMRGANLVHCAKMTGLAIQNILNFVSQIVSAESPLFQANVEFAEMVLNAQDITALVSSYLQGVIDHDTLLNNFREAGYIDAETTNEDIKQRINDAPPAGGSNSDEGIQQ